MNELRGFLDEVAVGVEAAIEKLLDREIDRWKSISEDAAIPATSVRRMVAGGGKRLRPAFCEIGWRVAGRSEDHSHVVAAGAALELLHTFALIHDDVMDASPRRRGAPTVHVALAEQHRLDGAHGDPDRFGSAAAILAGDLAFVYADQLMAAAPLEARGVFDELRAELVVGQYLDVVGAARRTRDTKDVEQIVRYKSAKYTVERPLHLGAAIAHRLELADALSRYGLPLGEAFQLRDDLLGAFGNSAVTGKPIGDDLREGKPTLLYAIAFERGGEEDRSQLDDLYGNPKLTVDEVERLHRVLVDTGARGAVEQRVIELRDIALGSISDIPASADDRILLEALAHFATERDF